MYTTPQHTRDSGYWGSRENSSSSLQNGHAHHSGNGLVIRAGIRPMGMADNATAATFQDQEEGTKNLFDQNGSYIGNVAVGDLLPTPKTFEILVQNHAGKQYRPRVQADFTVLQLKQILSEKWGIPPSQQNLVYAGENLKDHLTLGSYKMENMLATNGKVFLTTRLRGG